MPSLESEVKGSNAIPCGPIQAAMSFLNKERDYFELPSYARALKGSEVCLLSHIVKRGDRRVSQHVTQSIHISHFAKKVSSLTNVRRSLLGWHTRY